jgi:malonyl CoA-acyl carrier protein transacylase
VVEAVNFNDPVQTVIAGSKAAVDKACEVLKGRAPSARCRCRCRRRSTPA